MFFPVEGHVVGREGKHSPKWQVGQKSEISADFGFSRRGIGLRFSTIFVVMAFTLPPLPYAKSALAPHISEETVTFHYEKHHAGYITKLNQLTEGSPLASKSLEEIVKTEKGKIFNMAAQVRSIYNADFTQEGAKPMFVCPPILRHCFPRSS